MDPAGPERWAGGHRPFNSDCGPHHRPTLLRLSPCSLRCPVVKAKCTHLSRTGWKGDFNCCGGESGLVTRSLSARVGRGRVRARRQVWRAAEVCRPPPHPNPARSLPPLGQCLHQKQAFSARQAPGWSTALSGGPEGLGLAPRIQAGSLLSRARQPLLFSIQAGAPHPRPKLCPGSGFLARIAEGHPWASYLGARGYYGLRPCHRVAPPRQR